MQSLKNKKNLIKRINILLEILLLFAMYWLATFLRYVLPYGKTFAIIDSFQFVILALVFTTSMVLVTYISGDFHRKIPFFPAQHPLPPKRKS